MKIKFQTLGCKLNFSESSALANQFRDAGYQIVQNHQPTDVIVINSCVVTDLAEKKCRSAIRKARRDHPNSTIAVIGCFSQIRQTEIIEMEEVNLVAGNAEKHELVTLLAEYLNSTEKGIYTSDIRETRTFAPGYSMEDRTRTFLKIQDGCNHRCSFCTIPAARGRSRSASVADVIKMVYEISEREVKEIVLTGVNIGDFGKPHGESLLMLLQELSCIELPVRFRIGSVEPELLSDEIIGLIAKAEKLMPHFHLPLQAGSDAILQQMRRRYDTSLFANRVHKIASLIPDAFIACDVIAGFPGESDAMFSEGFGFISDLPMSSLHVFSFSERSGTPAAQLTPKIDPEVIKARSNQLHKLSHQKQRAFYNCFIGDTRDVLFETGNKAGNVISGFTDNYIRVIHPWHQSLANAVHPVKLQQLNKNGMMVGLVDGFNRLDV